MGASSLCHYDFDGLGGFGNLFDLVAIKPRRVYSVRSASCQKLCVNGICVFILLISVSFT